MLPPEEYEQAMRAADCHLQLSISTVQLADGEATIAGEVLRVFRGPVDLLGATLALRVCYASEDDDDWAPDGIGRIAIEELRIGRVLEAYVNAIPTGYEVSLDLYTIIQSATDAPQL